MATQHILNRNYLLAALDTTEYARLIPYLERVTMPLGEVYYEPGKRMRYAYFPTTAIVSLHYVLKNGAATEFSVVGNDGMLDVSSFTGGNMTGCAQVRAAGYGYKLGTEVLADEFDRGGQLQQVLMLYAQARMTHISQGAACMRHHTVQQRLALWLLQTLDRSCSNNLVLTQELIADMLGVRREGITQASGKLQKASAIRIHRGHITVLDRSALEDHACECYAVVKTESDRLLRRSADLKLVPEAHVLASNGIRKATNWKLGNVHESR
jgi:CRP-like cAMP-binding protein